MFILEIFKNTNIYEKIAPKTIIRRKEWFTLCGILSILLYVHIVNYKTINMLLLFLPYINHIYT